MLDDFVFCTMVNHHLREKIFGTFSASFKGKSKKLLEISPLCFPYLQSSKVMIHVPPRCFIDINQAFITNFGDVIRVIELWPKMSRWRTRTFSKNFVDVAFCGGVCFAFSDAYSTPCNHHKIDDLIY